MLRTDFEKQTEEEERGLKSDPFFSLWSIAKMPKSYHFTHELLKPLAKILKRVERAIFSQLMTDRCELKSVGRIMSQ